jgi:hypothetical protein
LVEETVLVSHVTNGSRSHAEALMDERYSVVRMGENEDRSETKKKKTGCVLQLEKFSSRS